MEQYEINRIIGMALVIPLVLICRWINKVMEENNHDPDPPGFRWGD